MKRTMLLLSALVLSLYGAFAIAGSCDIHYTRTACPGKEATSYKKCDGKQSCTHAKPAANMEACRVAAVAACANDRLDITKSKVITASFDGKAVNNKSGGTDHCLDYANAKAEFNQCD